LEEQALLNSQQIRRLALSCEREDLKITISEVVVVTKSDVFSERKVCSTNKTNRKVEIDL
jgi:hypothetical protein